MLRRLMRDRALLIGTVIITLLVLVAVFAAPLSTFPEHVTGFDPAHRLRPPGGTVRLRPAPPAAAAGRDVLARHRPHGRRHLLAAAVRRAAHHPDRGRRHHGRGAD